MDLQGSTKRARSIRSRVLLVLLHVLDPETVLLTSYRLDFISGDSSASVSLDGITGRVTVQ